MGIVFNINMKLNIKFYLIAVILFEFSHNKQIRLGNQYKFNEKSDSGENKGPSKKESKSYDNPFNLGPPEPVRPLEPTTLLVDNEEIRIEYDPSIIAF